jgi:hypothetical protein
MPQKVVQLSVADNLCQLAKEFKSGDPTMSGAIRKEFKTKSKNDIVRATVYLMEVIGSRDEQFKAVQMENKDLKELLKINNISLDGEVRTENEEVTKSAGETSGNMAPAVYSDAGDNSRGELGINTTKAEENVAT